MKTLHWAIVASFTLFTAVEGYAKVCTESVIRNALKSKRLFDFEAEGCTNTVVKISKGIELKTGMVVDGKGQMVVDWSGKSFKCDEIPRNKHSAVFFTSGNNNILRNFTISRSPEGIHLTWGRNNLVENVVFERICEDAITNGDKSRKSATDSIIRNVSFKNAPDKAVQCNGGSVTIENSEFRNIPRSIAGCTYQADGSNHSAKECPIVCDIKAFNNTVHGCSGGYAMRGAGHLQGKKPGKLTAIGNNIRNCKTPFMASQYGHVYAEDNDISGCDTLIRVERNGTGQACNNRGCKKEGGSSVVRRCETPEP